MSAPKGVLLVVWLLCAAGFAIVPDPAVEPTAANLARWARYAFFLMAAAHVVEFGLFFSRLKSAPGSLASHVLNTLVFGLLHVRDLPANSEQERA